MILEELLRGKGTFVHSISPQATLDDAVQALVRHNIGSLMVCREGESCDEPGLLGIITERDILRACAAAHGKLTEMKVADHMSSKLVTGSPGDQIENVMGLMTEKRIRHLPVMEAGQLRGLISIGDIVKAQHQQMVLENHYLKTYIQG